MADDSPRWELRQQVRAADNDFFDVYLAELDDWRRKRHLDHLEERKRDREAARRVAKGTSASATDYPWLKDDWVEPPVDPLRLRNRR